jgi:hypothetical protein
VRISTNNEIAKVNNNLDYESFQIYVTNAAGQGVAGAPVSVRLLPLYYYKGQMAFTTGVGWAPIATPVQCVNEDTNFNGVLDTGDNNQNMDGILWPGQSAAFTLDNNGVTDSWVPSCCGSGTVKPSTLGRSTRSKRARRPPVQSAPPRSTTDSRRPRRTSKILQRLAFDQPFGTAGVCTNPN